MKLITTTRMIILAAALAVGFRIVLALTYAPLYGNDSPSYAALAEMIESMSFDQYDGRRTPGYPLFMLMLRYNNSAIRITHNLAGLLSIFIMCRLMRRILPSHNCWPFMLLMGVSIQFAFYESIIQTEALSFLSIAASLYYFSKSTKHSPYNLILASSFSSVGALIRPHLIILVPIYLCVYLVVIKPSFRQAFSGVFSLLVPFVILIGGWIFFNYVTLSRVTFTTLPKADLIAHMIHYIDDADDQYAEVADAFKESYLTQRHLVESADDNRAVYTSYAGRMLRERGFTNQLMNADTINAMAKDLIRKHPWGYAQEVFSAWLRFWRVHIIIYSECFGDRKAVYKTITYLWIPIKILWLLLNVLFILFAPFVLFMKMGYERRVLLFTVYCLVFGASLSQALTQYYDNARFAIPFQPLVGVAMSIIAQTVIDKFHTCEQSPAPLRIARSGRSEGEA